MINLEKIKQRKKDLHLTNQELAERSGVPLGTINKIFSGATKSPKYNTMQALETVLGMYFYYDADGPYISYVKEARGSYDIHGEYTMKDYYALPDYVRAELIDGRFYYIPSPGRQHQELLGELYYFIKDYFRKKGEKGNVYLSPFDVCLDRDEKTVVQPDLCIISQMGNLNENGLKGIPDFIAEIISNSTAKKDYTLKLKKYWNAGVKEYWIIDPLKERIVTYLFQEEDMDMRIYRWKDQVPMGIYNDLIVDFGGF